MNTTQEQRAACLNYKTGLVYRCDLNTGDCGALLGNGDAESNDGSLFERSGTCTCTPHVYNRLGRRLESLFVVWV